MRAGEPSYDLRQDVSTDLPWAELAARFDALTGHGYSVSMFTRFDESAIRQVWVKSRTTATALPVPGAVPAARPLHMLCGATADAVTEQGGLPGAWLDRLPHFRLGHTPSRGDKVQSEYLVPRAAALAAISELRRLAPGFESLLQIAQIRTVAADDLWLSGSYGQDVVGVHFTWVNDVSGVHHALGPIEEALLPLGARPHWGKVFRATANQLRSLYPRFDDFRALRDRVDPDRTFDNAFLARCLG